VSLCPVVVASFAGVRISLLAFFSNFFGLSRNNQILTLWAVLSYAFMLLQVQPSPLLTPRQIASGIIIAWGKTIYRQFELLAGKAAPHDFLQLLIYKAATFNDDIIKIDTVRAYHSGPVRFNFFSSLRF